MADPDSLEHDDAARLTQYWRDRPDQLRGAITAAREQYQVPPKLPSGLRVGDFLVGESRRGTVLIGVALTGDCTAAGFPVEVEQAAAFVADNAGAFPQAGSRKKPKPGARVEVFLPPDVFTAQPSSIRGIPVRWFRWIPVDEQQVSLEESATTDATASASAGETVVPQLLAHLGWWADAIEAGTAAETPYRKALLVYNVAALLDWHTAATRTLPGQQPPDSRSHDAARKAVREFADAVHAVVIQIEGASGAKATRQLGKLVSASQKLCKRLSKHYPIAARLARNTDFEKPISPYELLKGWLAAYPTAGAEEPLYAGRKLPVSPPGDLVLQALAPVLAANALRDEGKLTPEACEVVRQACAQSVEIAVEVAVRSTKGDDRKRWRCVGQPAIEALRRPAAPRSSEAGT